MDSSFDPTYMGSGWGGDDATVQTLTQGSSHAFDKVPLPVLVSDIVHCQSDDDKIHLGVYSFGLFRVCGRVLSKELRDNATYLTICDPEAKSYDSCDKLSVVVYGSEQGSDNGLFVPNENEIIVALAKFRKFGDSVSCITFGTAPVENAEFLQVFKLEVELAKRYYTKNIPERIHAGEVLEFDGTLLSNIPFDRGTRSGNQNANQQNAYGNNYGTSNAQQSHNSGGNRGMTAMQTKLYDFIRTYSTGDDTTGVHISNIISHVGQNSSYEQDLQYLINEGRVYQTIDDNHYAAI